MLHSLLSEIEVFVFLAAFLEETMELCSHTLDPPHVLLVLTAWG